MGIYLQKITGIALLYSNENFIIITADIERLSPAAGDPPKSGAVGRLDCRTSLVAGNPPNSGTKLTDVRPFFRPFRKRISQIDEKNVY